MEKQGIGFKSLTEAIDTTNSGGRIVFHIFGALAEFERGVIKERTMAGHLKLLKIWAGQAGDQHH